ncbi:hypothetical protein PI124_g12334 [Phytophthora idaei]|nr:hypothetical protein PI125_g21070 [Phytophthora idaei]KAG3132940.1 hypothetical protein PI126_g19402 [Phytophthora idaei]KAG3242837.1 hypothetical protein PI124_g12334 [Phytophthora idaei]
MKCITRRTSTNSRGYVEHELTKNKMDCKKCFDFAGINEEGPANDKHLRLGNNENQWLSEETLPGFHNEMATYFGKMEFIARRLLKVFAGALGEEPTFFDQCFHGESSNHMRLNHYPATEDAEKTMGVYHHTDAGALTIRLQDDEVASSQVFLRLMTFARSKVSCEVSRSIDHEFYRSSPSPMEGVACGSVLSIMQCRC